MAKTKAVEPVVETETVNDIMLGSLSISMPEMRRNAREQAAKIEQDNHAKNGTISASKHLMAGIESHKRIKDYAAMQRAWWSFVTLPWFDGKGAPRATAAIAVVDLKVELGDRRRGFFALVDEFMPEYPNIRAQRKFEMGDLFDERDFPPPEVLRRKFAFRFDFCSLPNSDDIRTKKGISSAAAAEIAEEARKSEQARIKRAMETAAQRLYKVVKSMHDTMATPIGEKGAKFNNSKLENILIMADTLPMLNLTNDPKLAKMAAEAKKIAMKSPEELRENPDMRKRAADESGKLASKLSEMFNADTGDEDEE